VGRRCDAADRVPLDAAGGSVEFAREAEAGVVLREGLRVVPWKKEVGCLVFFLVPTYLDRQGKRWTLKRGIR